ncbi:hypothetical protein [Bacillus piscicola]|uniref:hypothetical protein n=1 Tax=Bacillus piscicola TaxID=1632684 RepID=UPI001F09A5B7|nr:hypothetical protein [Bacillus piscicola]
MLNLPASTFWMIVPWPFIWVLFGIVVFIIKKRDDDYEDSLTQDSKELNEHEQ